MCKRRQFLTQTARQTWHLRLCDFVAKMSLVLGPCHTQSAGASCTQLVPRWIFLIVNSISGAHHRTAAAGVRSLEGKQLVGQTLTTTWRTTTGREDVCRANRAGSGHSSLPRTYPTDNYPAQIPSSFPLFDRYAVQTSTARTVAGLTCVGTFPDTVREFTAIYCNTAFTCVIVCWSEETIFFKMLLVATSRKRMSIFCYCKLCLEKVDHFYLYKNFGKCGPIFIFSSYSAGFW